MRKLANLFLILFVVSAVFSIADELLQLFLAIPVLSWVHQFCRLSYLCLGTIVYLGFAFNRHLPKVIFFPLFIWIFWGLIGHWPFDGRDSEYSRLFFACGQLILGFAILQLNQQINHKSTLLDPSQFVGPAFSGQNLLRFCLVNVLVLPIALTLISYSFVDRLIETRTAGFVQLKPNGLYMTERVYQQEDKQIRLAGMIHLGEEDYFSDLTASFPGGRTLILAEGVTDTDGLMTEHFNYGKIADLLGLTSQEKVRFKSNLIDVTDLDLETTGSRDIPDLLPADIDLKQFDPRTIEVLNALAKYILNAESLTDGYLAFNQWSQNHVDPNINDIIMNDLIDKRNRSVVSYLPKALRKYDTIVIPWGALHMKGIEQAVLKKGFQLAETRERLSIDFLLLPYDRLWKNLIGADES
ncbi:hypothetical protein [uncultured Desulfuromusa sp.]|uniref:hypothetical protein n=1 Tax=uncultured Desulfuromusa sp. TaxID=219183 RepID=UPI002AA7C45F|nr:hypothetical protein [uncultured Desulfuromusa sp.]